MEKVLSIVEKYILYIVLVLFPVFFLSNYTSPFVIGKVILLVTGVLLLTLCFIGKSLIKGSIRFVSGNFDMGILLLALVYLISTIFITPNKMEAYFLPGTTTFVLAGSLLYFIINQFDAKTKIGGSYALLISSLLVALISLLASLEAFSRIPQLSPILRDASFNPMGSVISSVTFMSFVIVFTLGLLIKAKDAIKKFFLGSCFVFIFFALIIQISSLIPGKIDSPRFLSTKNSWDVAIDSLKKSPILGMGPANYLTAFNLFRPLSYNASDLWSVRFANASNYYLTAITELGLAGLVVLAVLLVSICKYLIKTKVSFKNLTQVLEKGSILVLLIIFVLLPSAPYMVVFLFIALAIFSESESKVLNLKALQTDSSSSFVSRLPLFIVTLPIIALIIFIVYLAKPILAAEKTFNDSLNALKQNDAKSTYELMNSAINQNPKVDRYHASFAQVNTTLALSLASKKEVTENDRQTINQLVQQAISEGKATVALNSQRSGNWEILAQIYRSIMPFAQGADRFAIQTYQQAIALDPINPNLRINLGSIYYSLGQYDKAIDAFKLAVLAKPDLPNAHYNLAITYRENNNYDLAIEEMDNVIKLVKKDSKDYKLATKVLEELKSKKAAAKPTTENSENLTQPEEVIETNITPPIELPQEASPPASLN